MVGVGRQIMNLISEKWWLPVENWMYTWSSGKMSFENVNLGDDNDGKSDVKERHSALFALKSWTVTFERG